MSVLEDRLLRAELRLEALRAGSRGPYNIDIVVCLPCVDDGRAYAAFAFPCNLDLLEELRIKNTQQQQHYESTMCVLLGHILTLNIH